MLNNFEFLEVIKESFYEYLRAGSSTSTAKLKVLHGKIAADLHQTLGEEFNIMSQGYELDKESYIEGRYIILKK